MRKLVLPLAAFMAVGLCVKIVPAAQDSKKEDSGKEQKITGILIDSHCAEKFTDKDNPEKAAADHKAACCVSCAKKGGGFVLLHGKDQLKLDEKGNKLAMKYLEKKDAKTKVTITGEKEGDELKVSKIMAAETPKST